MKNIFFIGKAGTGKTTLADYLVKNYNYTLIKFADPVYFIAKRYFGMKKKNRFLLQIIGTEGGREIDKNIWINNLLNTAEIIKKINKEYFNKDVWFVVDDCRFLNEIEALLDKGWAGIYLYCDDKIRFDRLKKRDGVSQEKFAEHSSEKEVEQIFFEYAKELYFINTEVKLEKIYEKLDKILDRLK